MNNTFSNKLKLIRKKYNLTQKDLVQMLGISRSYLARLESGQTLPTNKLIEHISLKFKISRDWLLNDTEEEFPLSTQDELLDVTLLCKYELLNDEYKQFIMKQIEYLLEIQQKISQQKES